VTKESTATNWESNVKTAKKKPFKIKIQNQVPHVSIAPLGITNPQKVLLLASV
jgi:hypothetical protein